MVDHLGARRVVPGLTDTELLRVLQPVSAAEDADASRLDTAVAAERFARAALSTAIEPGDLDAGRLVGTLGAVGLLRAITEGADAVGVHEDGRIGECLARWRPRLSLTEAVKTLDRAARIGARLVTPESTLWPGGFDALEDGRPLALWVRGDTGRMSGLARSVALVGARASTRYGEHVAMESAAGLADRGFTIVSGGAYGIDAAAHRAALLSGGVTIAFLAGGADRLYPAGNSELLRRVAAEGLLIAELPPGATPTRWRFLMRNRLIAAAATATVVVEAGHRSGSLNTAGHAAQMGRPLGAVPGSVLSPASAGCHRLIREYGATCVTTTEEMAELADPLGTGPRPGSGDDPDTDDSAGSGGSGSSDDPKRSVLVELRRSRRVSADEIAARSALPFSTVAAVLGRLDLAGRARERDGGWTLVDKRCV
ncbi:DNA-processing protein DprA [Leifsonia sp. SIMBA_070]|uniref:DNA-processing protein DprA n=1 Tax=Leifsonia sp. SIMBA_070 TaxID=3085810 RepID=UPI00397BE33B